MISLTPVYAVAGAAFVGKFIEDFMMEAGKGQWVWIVKTIMYVGVGVYALNVWMDGVRMVAAVFGVWVP
jgi:hypothetical protein